MKTRSVVNAPFPLPSSPSCPRASVPLCVNSGADPYILEETEDFAVVFKPARMHSSPLRASASGNTLLDWYASVFPPLMDISGRKAGEGGLLHRLDFETQGLVLFAKNQQSFDNLLRLQEEKKIIKEYNAVCQKTNALPPGFPPPPPAVPLAQSFVIASYFRPFGPGRKQVRPVTDGKGVYYQTEITNVTQNGNYTFSVKLRQGFRHQIRCHLAWIGYPIINDSLYGAALYRAEADGFLALCANGLAFPDPNNGTLREYYIPNSPH